ncbi:MAG: hypothetical protein U0470_03545 [Anaerolineae bacterium]
MPPPATAFQPLACRRPLDTPGAHGPLPITTADRDGLVAIGGDLSPERLLAAYGGGIFPWPHTPAGRCVLARPRWALSAAALHVPRRLARAMRGGRPR